MSVLRKKAVAAILLADIHLSLKPPIWRSAEKDWFAAMKRPLLEVSKLALTYQCPVICAGDIFDKWNAPPELINFALENLPPNMYAIPGQHDLPLHQYEDIEKSAYWTLCLEGRIQNLPRKDIINISSNELTLYGFPYGSPILKNTHKSEFLQIAIVHEYIWIPGCSYPTASIEHKLTKKKASMLKGYDVAIFGDNHIGFHKYSPSTQIQIFNCGTLMRRKSDEIDYKPQVGLLHTDGTIEPYYLDTSKDKYIKTIDSQVEKDDLDIGSFVRELEKLDSTTLDFEEAVEQYCKRKRVSSEVKKIILEAMEV